MADAVVPTASRDLHAELAGVKFLGSYPAAGAAGPAIRPEVETSCEAPGRRLDRRPWRAEIDDDRVTGPGS